MGAKTWMLSYSRGDASAALESDPELDRDASANLARELFPSENLVPLDDGSLGLTCPPDKELLVGCFPGISILAAKEFGIDSPSKIDTRFLEHARGERVCLHAMHSVVDWFAFAVWEGGKLVRSLSLSPDSGVIEDIGERMPFEIPYWSGEHPATDPDDEEDEYPFVFHPLELGEAALLALFGYQLEGPTSNFDPDGIPLLRFQRSRSWWSRLRGGA